MNRKSFFKTVFGGFLGLFAGKAVAETPKLNPAIFATKLLPKSPKIRLWKLGNLEHKILPTQEAVQRLADILMNPSGKDLDIIWGPDLTVETIEGNPEDIQIIETPDGKRIIIKADKKNEGDLNE